MGFARLAALILCALAGSGNEPNYTGTVRVVGPDVFELDRDRDGVGCE